MYIRKIMLEDIRGFGSGERRVELDLERPGGRYAGWTVLAGRNGSGKSTLLKAVALAVVGADAALVLKQSFVGWVRHGTARAHAAVNLYVDADRDQWEQEFGSPRDGFESDLEVVQREHGSIRQNTLNVNKKSGQPKDRWAWSAGTGWFIAGYGPYRRLMRRALDTQQQVIGSPRITRLAGLFRDDVSLIDSIDWLRGLHLRRLEEKAGAEQLLSNVLKLLNDGLLPDGARADDVDSEGLWVTQRGVRLPLEEMGDGYRMMAALVTDIVRQIHDAFQEFELAQHEGRLTVPYPGVVFIDEVELHLHPSWQRNVGFWLKEHFPHLQFIVTTHSPFICQAADPRGLIRLPAPGADGRAEHVSDSVYKTVVNGSVDDAVLSELFGLEHAYSEQAERIRERVAWLEARLLRGNASAEEVKDLDRLVAQLPDTGSALVDRVVRKYEKTEPVAPQS